MTHPLSIDNSGIEPPSNCSRNCHLRELLSRRVFLGGGLGLAAAAFLPGCAHAPAAAAARLLGFTPIAANRADTVTVPPGYNATPFVPWGTPIRRGAPAYRPDAGNTGAEQEWQVGSHHDGLHFFPMNAKFGGRYATEGLLVMNHEYVEPALLHAGGPRVGAARPVDQVRKEMAAHGVSVLHIRQTSTQWELVVDSPYNRRITAMTPMELRGPVRGHAKVRTHYSPAGEACRGTFNNCAHGVTPWHTYLAAEENWAGYFLNRDLEVPREHARYGVSTLASRYRWDSADAADGQYQRFDASRRGTTAVDDYRNEPNHFGWLVEIDPFAPESVPQKRTALGRLAREGVVFAPVVEGRPLVCYSGDDTKNEYLYKFVSAELYRKASASGHLLDRGILYAARFNEDGSGEWLPLDLTDPEFRNKCAAVGVAFSDQADLLLNTRLAADIAGATKMDRPEWGAVDPGTGEVYFTLTNNTDRAPNGVDAANPRGPNAHGHIIRWRARGSDHADTRFTWDIFLLAGPQSATDAAAADAAAADGAAADGAAADGESAELASPDGLVFDARGVLWIQTDMAGAQLAAGPFGNNQMFAADPVTREIRRFLVGPVGCEITGVAMTPDMRTFFVNIQHPGEGSAPDHFTSHWPDGGQFRPRSATVIIRKDDGGVIGT